MQHDDDPRKRGHHDNNGRCQCDQRQSDQNPKRTVDLSVTVIVGNADSIRRIQLSYLFRGRGCSRRIDHRGNFRISRQMTLRCLNLYRCTNTQYAYRDQQAYHIDNRL